MGGLRDIILIDKMFYLIDGDLPLDVPAGRLLQELGRLQTVHRLQTNGHTPRLGELPLGGITLTDILVEIDILRFLSTHVLK